jgi:hypothetical protein
MHRLQSYLLAALLVLASLSTPPANASTPFSFFPSTETKRIVTTFGTSIASGATQQIFSQTGTGTVKEVLLAIYPINSTQIGRGTTELIVAVDGTTVIDCDLGTIFGANFATAEQRFETPNMAIDLIDFYGADYWFRYWMPYKSSITISLKNNEASNPIIVWTDVAYSPYEFYPWKLKSAEKPFLSGMPSALCSTECTATGSYITPTQEGNQSVVYLDSSVTGDTSGVVVWQSNSYYGGSTSSTSISANQSFLENRVVAFLDGESTSGTPSFDSSGTEEFFATGFYGDYLGIGSTQSMTGLTFYMPFNNGSTSASAASIGSTLAFATDFLARFGGLKFNTGIKLTQIAKPAGYGQSSAYVYESWFVLYYTPYS